MPGMNAVFDIVEKREGVIVIIPSPFIKYAI